MRTYISKTILIITVLFIVSCVKDSDYSTPNVECVEQSLTVTNTLSQIKDMYAFGGTQFETDIVIEGYVVSSDETGNIYKSISIQDKAENPTSAIKISIDETDTYTKYEVGRKIYIKLNGLAIDYSYGSLQIGVISDSELEGISSFELDDYIVRSCEVAEITPKVVAIEDLNEDMLEMLIELEDVQFTTEEIGESYANVANTSTVNRTLQSFDSSCNLLSEIDIRNSGYADFKDELLPEGKGSVIAIFSNYYDDYQLYLRSTDDVNLTETRCDYTNALNPNITMAEIVEMYEDSMVEFGVSNNYVVEGYVISSDEEGNFEERLIIQDAVENPTAGIQILLENDEIYQSYNVGDRVYLKLDNLYMDEVDGVLTIGYNNDSSVTQIEEDEYSSYIINSEENFEITPTEISITEVEDYKNILVTILDVQLIEDELGSAYTYFSGDSDGNRTLETCGELKVINVFTNGEATFANSLFPEGHGSITGVLGDNIEIRSEDDVIFNEARCENTIALTPNITLSEVVAMYEDSTVEFGVSNNYVVEGYVISSDEEGNFEERLIIQDAVENPTAGIQILLENDEIYQSYNVGDRVFLKLNNLYLDEVNGVLTIGYYGSSSISEIEEEDISAYVINSGDNFEITPTEIFITDTDDVSYINTLVTIQNVQLIEDELGSAFTYFSGDTDGTRTLETCGESKKISVFTNGEATFANELFPEGHGSITGILSTYIEVRTENDVSFTEVFETCPVIVPKIMITEVADPDNETSARFVELYNAGDTEIDLTGWKLNKYVNGSTSASSGGLDLTGYSIAPGEFLIIANTGFVTSFSITPDIETTYMSANGDDSFQLVDNLGVTMDMYGVIGEDGNGTNWEFLDGRAVRNIDIVEPNIVFDASEWTIYSDANNSLISNPNSPQNAPDDYNPNIR